jgi:hypothetical protein
MSDKKRKKVYDALIEGATQGLSDASLYDFVIKKCPKTTSRRIVRASLLALSDPEVKDAQVLRVVYALAIKHRLDGGPEAAPDDIEPISEVIEEKPIRRTKAPRKIASQNDPASV